MRCLVTRPARSRIANACQGLAQVVDGELLDGTMRVTGQLPEGRTITDMSKIRVHISASLDGYVAGPNQSMDSPLGEGGERLHDWLVELKAWRELHGMEGGEENASDAVLREENANVGAEIMGRGKFGPPGGGSWGDNPWEGWWGDDPPFHKPVFVLTHHARDPLTLSDTTYTFVTDGIQAALQRASEAAGDRDVFIGGGAKAINHYLAAGLVDELELHLVPILLGGGARLFDGVGPDVRLDLLRTVEAPGVTHLKYRVLK
jgi:dihydrofolate reductase